MEDDPFVDDARGPDPFSGMDDLGGDQGGPVAFDDDARSALFGLEAKEAPAEQGATGIWPQPNSDSGSGLAFALPLPPPTLPPVRIPLGVRLQGPLRVALGVLQIAFFLVAVVAAVVVGRGGRLDDLFVGDWRAALQLTDDADGAPLILRDVQRHRRRTASGLDVVVISGVVHNRGSAPVSLATVTATTAGGATGLGYAWTPVTALGIDGLESPEDLKALGALKPPATSSTVAPGDRAPFVVVLPGLGPDEGISLAVAAPTTSPAVPKAAVEAPTPD